MTGWSKPPKAARRQMAIGTILTLAGMVWIILILFILKPDQILPAKEIVSEAHEGMRSAAGVPFDAWTFGAVAEVARRFLGVLLLTVLFVASRYG